jgi:hypothetical protein
VTDQGCSCKSSGESCAQSVAIPRIAHYLSWRFVPDWHQERFTQRSKGLAAGGKAISAYDLSLAEWLCYTVNLPRIYCVGPSNYMWQWPDLVPIMDWQLQSWVTSMPLSPTRSDMKWPRRERIRRS